MVRLTIRLPTVFVVLGACLVACSPEVDPTSCPVDTAEPREYGPRLEPGDHVYTSLLSPDGHEFYYFKRVGAAELDYRIFRSFRTENGWTKPEVVFLGGDFSDLYPSLSQDGDRLVFSSYRPVPEDTSAHNAHVWMSRRTNDAWSEPQFVAASRLNSYHSGLIQDNEGNLALHVISPDWSNNDAVHLSWSGENYADDFTARRTPATTYWRKNVGDSLHVWNEVAGPDGIALMGISVVDAETGRRAPAQYFVTQESGSTWSELVRAGGGLGEGSPNFAWFSPDGCYVHYTKDYSTFMRVPVSAVLAPPTD